MSSARILNVLVRFGALFALGALAGLVLGGCGGGGENALNTRTGPSATRPAPTSPASTEAGETVEPTTPIRTLARTTTRTAEVVETTTAATTTTPPELAPPPVTITTTQTETETATQTRTAIIIRPTTTTSPSPTTTSVEPAVSIESTTTVTPASSSSTSNWAWMALAIALLGALAIGFILWRRQQSSHASWAAQKEDLDQRSLLAMDNVLAQGSIVTGKVQALAAEAKSLEARAPEQASKASASLLRARLDDLAATLEADRNLRLSSPPPSEEQLNYSSALIRQQVEQLQAVFRRPTDRA